MLHWLGVALILAALLLVGRWFLARHQGTAGPFPRIIPVVLVVLGCAAIAPHVMRIRLEGELSAVASRISGRSVKVKCQSFAAALLDLDSNLGHVAFDDDGDPQRLTLIKRDQCRDLAGYLSSDKVSPTRDEIVAVHVLTHEAVHMSGVTGEAETECYALQRDAEVAEALGAPPEGARALATSYWADVYPSMPTDYRSDECGPDGRFDLGLASAPWAAR